MVTSRPILELVGASAIPMPGWPHEPALDLVGAPGDLILVESRDDRRREIFADICAGTVPLRGGHASFLGHDWSSLSASMAANLRGHVGRIFGNDAWIGFLDMETNILMSALHHTRRNRADLLADAARLAQHFGLPGLPLGRPENHAPAVLRRAACVRAFLGHPLLLLLEDPIAAHDVALLSPLLMSIRTARNHGAAVVWMTRSDLVWNDHSLPVTARLRLLDRGIQPVRTAV